MAHVLNRPLDPADDLSAELRQALPREPGDIVRCTRVNQHEYRCNWWRSLFVDTLDNPGLKGAQLSTTYRVHRSAFLEVHRQGDRLRIDEIHPSGRRFGSRVLSE